MKKIAFIGRSFDLKEFCIHNRVHPSVFVRLDPTGHQPQELIRGLELSGVVVSDWAWGQTGTKELVDMCLRRIKY